MTAGRFCSVVAAVLLAVPGFARAADTPGTPDRAVVDRYCLGCHSVRAKAGNFVLEGLDPARASDDVESWEKVVRKLRGGLMPPPGRPRPDATASDAFRAALERNLDGAATAHPNPGRTETVHRLNRIEYVNAVRDLLAVEVNAPDLLPADDSSYGFDNIAGVLKMSPALMERYLAAAKVVSRSAVGAPPPAPATAVYRVSPETQQAVRIDPLPYGTRGGTVVRHLFPVAGEYELKIAVGGYRGRGDVPTIVVMLDGARVKVINPSQGDAMTLRLPIPGGPHDVGVTFLRSSPDLVEQSREPFLNPEAPSGTGGGPTGLPARLTSVTIVGPYNPSGPGDTPSRRRIFACSPTAPAREAACARTILTSLARRAYRGMQTPANVQVLVDFYQKGRADGRTFEQGIEFAVRRLLVSPEFLYRIENDPVARAANVASSKPSVYKVKDLELASRLSFFLWSSIPDDELLDAASRGVLSNADVLTRQVKRMLADPRSETLMRNFGGQWLLVRNMATVRPGETYSFAFDETLRQSMQRETELFLDSVMREDRGVMELLTANYTFVNERLAQNYGIPNVQGHEFRRVTLPADSPRGGLLGQGSILTVTSPAIRTSPVIRGKWILNNILGSPPPDPPPNVPALSDQKTQAKMKTMRERMAQHRSNPACASCHSMIDPAGFALENFDAIGRWRTVDDSFNPIDPSGALPDGSAFASFAEFRAALASRPERFAHTFTEKLLTYALGRGLEYYDMPAVRKILADTAPDSYRIQSIILGIVNSYPFRYRRANEGSVVVGGRKPMIITKMSMPRRTFLRGVGAAIALPWLDAMKPALSAATVAPQRLGFFYVPNGMYLPNFHPAGNGGTTFELTPILTPLASVREHVVVVSGLSNMPVLANDQGGGVHTRNHAGWLSGVLPKRTEGANITSAKTADQYAADKLGADTPLRSLELTLESNFQVGNCEAGYSCAYLNSTSWRAPNAPLPHEGDPRVVFQRLFGDGGSVASRLEEMKKDRSILDSVMESVADLRRRLGAADRTAMADYLDSVREVEQRISRAELTNATTPLPVVDQPSGIPDEYDEHAKLLMDLQLLAYQGDITRVSCLQIGRELSGRTYPWIGVPEAHHGVSHHQRDPHNIQQKTKIDAYNMSLFTRVLEKMRDTADGDGTLLDHSLLVYGAGMGDGDRHTPLELPVVLAGHAGGQLKTGRHIRYPENTPFMNLCLTLLAKVDVTVDKLGDSTGLLTDL